MKRQGDDEGDAALSDKKLRMLLRVARSQWQHFLNLCIDKDRLLIHGVETADIDRGLKQIDDDLFTTEQQIAAETRRMKKA